MGSSGNRGHSPINGVEISLCEVTRDNWVDCIRLSLHPEQASFVASNVDTIAESRFEPHYRLRAICAAGRPVGFLAFCPENDPEDPETYWLFRFMIDREHQGKRYGTVALKLAIAEMRALGAKVILTMHKPENQAAARLYAQSGFKESGMLDDGDILLRLT